MKGTLDYLAPEVIIGNSYSSAVDVWAIGVLAYELICGYSPFKSKNDDRKEKFNLILKNALEKPAHMSNAAFNFILDILQSDPRKRMTIEEVEEQPWLQNMR